MGQQKCQLYRPIHHVCLQRQIQSFETKCSRRALQISYKRVQNKWLHIQCSHHQGGTPENTAHHRQMTKSGIIQPLVITPSWSWSSMVMCREGNAEVNGQTNKRKCSGKATLLVHNWPQRQALAIAASHWQQVLAGQS